ncbi:enoyl-CoA hydratase/isomerase family protein [Rhodoligotrophos defluvii]|uniref:enoyl-CoA hydratase/isomerase family protein n=1 Tax=Rhodoligotrophos defluvii TaxID=2561934 RepID=UPI0010C981F9|nr:enoyl-CoA hydratase/isomerase family protein [Rhodoligotrophos defluvii]
MEAVNQAASAEEERVQCAVRDGVATITLNRPEQLNPLDRLTVAALLALVRRLEEDSSISVVVLRGAGRAFSAGGDLEGYMALYRDRPKFMKFLRDLNHLLEEIERSEKIYIAVVHGHCVAGGLELMLACDIVLAAHEAQIADGHLNFAQLPGAGGSQRLPRTIGPLKAKLLVLTGRAIGGEEAERMGLVSLSVPLAELEAAVDGVLADLKRKSPLGLKGAKYLINTGGLGARDAALELELQYVHHYATTSHDAYEGLAAFKEKRKPDLKGE